MKKRIIAALKDAYAEFAEKQIKIVKSARKEGTTTSRRVTIMLDEFLMTAVSLNPEAFPADIHKAENARLQEAFAKYDIKAEELLDLMAKWTKQLASYKNHEIEGINTTVCTGSKDRPARPERNRIFFELI